MPYAATRATELLGIRHPIVQGPFGGGLSSVALTALVSRSGGLGSFGAHGVAPARIGELTAAIRAATDAPFALNLWVSDHDAGGLKLTPAEFDRAFAAFAPIYAELGVARPELPERFHPSFAEQVDALIAVRPPVFSFVFGIPEARILAECRRLGIRTIGAATSIAEGEALDAAGVDLIVATGAEAGGHRPSFLQRAEDSLIGTFSLVQLIASRVRAPVIAAGGIADARGLRAALQLGAEAAQIGTAFLACIESGTHDLHRQWLFGDAAQRTVLTRSFTGRLARGLRNRWTDDDTLPAARSPAPFPVQSWLVGQLRAAALAAGRADLISLWGGQIAPNLRHRSAADLMRALVDD
jgi:nitronate monooxygenase